MITLEDIARQAGVSHSTVSRALADSPLVNVATKERIQQLAREAGYQVNQVARNLKSRSTRTIGLVVPEVSNPFYPKLVQQVADAVRLAGYSLQLHLSGTEQDAEIASLASLREHRVDGILLVSGEFGLVGKDQIDSLIRSTTPVVIMGWVEGAENLDLVTGDDAAGGRELANHLLNLGHRRISTIGKRPHRGIYDRMLGFTQALSEAGIAMESELNIEVRSEKEVEAAVAKLLSRANPPTAIFAYQDSMAAEVYGHLNRAGFSIPGDITVVGFDDIDLASYIYPKLTTVGTHIGVLASAFVDLLFSRIQATSADPAPKQVVVTPRLIVRASSAPPKSQIVLGTTPI